MADDDLIPFLDRLKGASVCTVGDVMIDRWVYGRVERISPEAPVPVFVEERVETKPGGAGNVAANISALGITGYQNVLVHSGQPGLKERFVVGRQQIFRRDAETIRSPGQAAEDEIFHRATHGSIHCLILSDYGKGMLTVRLCQRLIGWAREHDVPVVVDPKGADWSKYWGATVITPNEAEYGLVRDKAWTIGDCGVLLTRGANGMSLLSSDITVDPNLTQAWSSIPARRREVFDVTGAGDTVVAVLGACLSVGITLEDAARIANAAAGVVVSKPGTAVCTLDELREELAR